MNDQQRDDMLTRIDERTTATYKALFGNGQPGLIRDVAVLQDDMRQREAEAAALRDAVPSKRDKALVSSGVLTSVLIAIFMAIKEVFTK